MVHLSPDDCADASEIVNDESKRITMTMMFLLLQHDPHIGWLVGSGTSPPLLTSSCSPGCGPGSTEGGAIGWLGQPSSWCGSGWRIVVFFNKRYLSLLLKSICIGLEPICNQMTMKHISIIIMNNEDYQSWLLTIIYWLAIMNRVWSLLTLINHCLHDDECV